MNPLSETALRDSFVNVSRRERAAITIPDLDSIEWDRIDFLGWRDPKLPLNGCVVAEVDGEPVGILLRRSEASASARPQCSWCEDVRLPNPVAFFSARRAGAAGRRGDTIGTLVCEEFQCSANARKPPPPAYLGFDVEAAVWLRVETLREHVANFARRVGD